MNAYNITQNIVKQLYKLRTSIHDMDEKFCIEMQVDNKSIWNIRNEELYVSN